MTEDVIAEARRVLREAQDRLGALHAALVSLGYRLSSRADDIENVLDVLDEVQRDLSEAHDLHPADEVGVRALASRSDEILGLLEGFCAIRPDTYPWEPDHAWQSE